MCGVAFGSDSALNISLKKTTQSPEHVVGSWMGDIHSQLLWHMVIGQDFERPDNFPT